jgi:carotenoid cleavage dioxygenase-like enzyme
VFSGAAAITDNASVSVARLGEAYVALTDGALPMRFDPATLATLGVVARRSDAGGGQLTTAHPHVLGDGSLVNFGVTFGRRCRYTVFAAHPRARRRRVVAEWATAEPAYVHSFGLTRRYAVVVECPYVVHLLGMLLSGRPFAENFRWRPERGTRFHLVDLLGERPRVTCEAPPFFTFHHVNAYDDGDAVVVDLVAYDDAAVVDALYLERLRDPAWRVPPGLVTRWRLPVAGGTARREATWDVPLELPRVAGDRDTRPYRYAYGVGATHAGAFLDQLVKLDVETGEARTWSRPRTYAGEPVFVPAPDRRAEDDGVVLSLVLDAAREASALVVLDARTLDEVARAEAPHAIPPGFHGEFFGDAPPLAAAVGQTAERPLSDRRP